MYPGKTAAYDLDRIVGRGIVYHEHLAINAFKGTLHTMQALLHVAAHIIADDNDR